MVRFLKLGSFGNFDVFNQRDAGPNFLTTVGHRRRSSFAKASEDRGFALVRGNDGHDRSFITREFNGVALKENGTIPFYRRFFDGIIKIQKLQARSPRLAWRGSQTRNTPLRAGHWGG